jgi:hypothetical protein
MRFKKIVFGLCFSAGLLFSLPAFAFTYSRTPADYTISNPVNFSMSGATYEEINDACGDHGFAFWRLTIYSNEFDETSTDIFASSTFNFNLSLTLPINEYVEVLFVCLDSEEMYAGAFFFEGEGFPEPPIMFEVVAGAPAVAGGNIITLPADFATSALAYAGQLFTDLSTIILLLIGLPIGFWVIKKTLFLKK